MEYFQYVRKTDLARNTHQVIRNVLRGQTTIIESHGQPEVAIVDVVDYQLQRAALRYLAAPQDYSNAPALTEDAIKALPNNQDRYDLALAHYLAGQISLERTSELLGTNFYDLQTRLARLGVPMKHGPTTPDELRAEIEAVDHWEAGG